MTETKQSELMGDIWGGLTAAIVALPLALAFGVAAFAPLGAEYASTGALVGLLGSIYTGFAAAKFGGTPSQITGPTGPMTVVSTAFIAQIVAVHGANLPVIAILMALGIVIGGAVQILIGLSGGGKVVKYTCRLLLCNLSMIDNRILTPLKSISFTREKSNINLSADSRSVSTSLINASVVPKNNEPLSS